jgi:hypothetical protein
VGGMRLSANVTVPTLFGGGGGGGGGSGNTNSLGGGGGGRGGGGGGVGGGGSGDMHDAFRAQLTDFLSAKARVPSIEFASTLDGSERRAVHEIATELGLMHTSKGVGTQRRIVVWRKGKPPPGVEGEPESDAPKRKAGGSSLSVLGLFNSQAKRVRDGGRAGRSGVGATGWAGPQ